MLKYARVGLTDLSSTTRDARRGGGGADQQPGNEAQRRARQRWHRRRPADSPVAYELIAVQVRTLCSMQIIGLFARTLESSIDM